MIKISIEVRVPKEITEYKEKILFGLSIRQLICFGSAISLGIASYYIISKYIGEDLASYIVIFETIPLFALGFFRKDGFTFEKYISLILKHKTKISKRIYKTELNIDRYKLNESEGRNVTKEKGKRKRYYFKRKKPECKIFKTGKKERKAKSKVFLQSAKKVRKEYQHAKQKSNKDAKEQKNI